MSSSRRAEYTLAVRRLQFLGHKLPLEQPTQAFRRVSERRGAGGVDEHE